MKYLFSSFIGTFISSFIGISTATLFASPVMAETHSHDAHVHGEAILNLVIDGNELLLELESPAANLLGFEHAPQNQVQKQQLKKTQSLLSNVDSLVELGSLNCQLVSAEIEMPYADHKNDHHDSHHGHDHNNGHSDDHHDDHHKKHHDTEVAEHSEIRAQYSLNCPTGKPIERLTLPLFQHFSGLEKLQVMWINGNQQGASRLTANHSVLILNR